MILQEVAGQAGGASGAAGAGRRAERSEEKLQSVLVRESCAVRGPASCGLLRSAGSCWSAGSCAVWAPAPCESLRSAGMRLRL